MVVLLSNLILAIPLGHSSDAYYMCMRLRDSDFYAMNVVNPKRHIIAFYKFEFEKLEKLRNRKMQKLPKLHGGSMKMQ